MRPRVPDGVFIQPSFAGNSMSWRRSSVPLATKGVRARRERRRLVLHPYLRPLRAGGANCACQEEPSPFPFLFTLGPRAAAPRSRRAFATPSLRRSWVTMLRRPGTMRRRGLTRFTFTALLLAKGLTAADGEMARVIVKFRAGSALASAQSSAAATAARAAALGTRLGLLLSGGAAVSDRAQVVFATGLTSAELAGRLAREGDVEYAVPDERRQI